MSDRVLVFDLSGDFGHFRRPETVSSPLTYPLPPRPALAGLVGAILGIEKDAGFERLGMERFDLAVGLRGPVSTLRLGINHLKAQSNKDDLNDFAGSTVHNPTRIEFLRAPRYRVWVRALCDEATADFTALRDRLANRRPVFTPSLGLANLLADFAFVGEWAVEMHAVPPTDWVAVASWLPLRACEPSAIDFTNARLTRDQTPVDMRDGRRVVAWAAMACDRNGQPIRCRPSRWWRVATANGEPEIVVPFLENPGGNDEHG